MQFLYNITILIARFFIPLSAIFSPKMSLFWKGRKETFAKIKSTITSKDTCIWMHCASLGEFEQGRPVLERLKLHYPNYKIVLSFFSPSGYEVRKDYELADVVVYLPLDSPKNAELFLDKVHPSLVIFVKYDFWPNILAALRKRNIQTILVSGIFRDNQVFFNSNRRWFQNNLQAFNHFFVQNSTSVKLLNSIGYKNVSQSGDTRFDRVFDLVHNKKDLKLIKSFAKNYHILVAGSTWEKDEVLLIHYINTVATDKERFIIAPHNIKKADMERISRKITQKTLLYSQANSKNIQNIKVLIIDSIGLLTSIYAYANVAYVGGGFGSGIHNILEPATYGIPILIGPNYQKFQEATDLIAKKGCFEIQIQENLNQKLQEFSANPKKASSIGKIALQYVQENTGATDLVMEYIEKNLE